MAPLRPREGKLAATEESSTLLEILNKTPQMKVLSVLAEKPNEELTKTEIAQRAGIGRTTLYRVWEDLEKMKTITPSRHVGAVTLYRLNQDSTVVQSLLNITRGLRTVSEAVGKIEEIRDLERAAKTEFGHEMPAAPKLLAKFESANAVGAGSGIPISELKLTRDERAVLDSLVEADLLREASGNYYLTGLGAITARGATKIWKQEQRESLEETLSSAKVALDLINQEIKKLQARSQK
jgi:Fe2+ or Zn2+ uptake regulation protein